MANLLGNGTTFANIQAVIWDKDGTLADSRDYLRRLGHARSRLIDAQIPGVQEPLLMAFGIDGGDLNPAGLMAVGSRTENEIAAAAYIAETGRDWLEAISIAKSAFTEAATALPRKASLTPLFPDIRDLLTQLAQAGIPQAIASADSTANVEDFVTYHDLTGLITVAVGIDGLPGKPDPALYERVCDRLQLDPGQTLYIGDTRGDAQMTQVAGGHFLGVTWGGAAPTDWQEQIYLTQSNQLTVRDAAI